MNTPLQASARKGHAVGSKHKRGAGWDARSTGFTLMEVIMGMSVFTLLSLGITSSVLQTYRLSQMNILRTAAYTVAQGYMEQIISMDPNTLEAASEPWATTRPPLPCEAINDLLDSGNESYVDNIYTSPLSTAPASENLTLNTNTPGDVWNTRNITVSLTSNTSSISLTDNTTTNTLNAAAITMTMYMDVNIKRAWYQQSGTWLQPTLPYFLISIDFQYKSNGYLMGTWQTGTIRMVSTSIPGRS